MTCWALSGVETTQVKLKLLLCGVEICLFLLDRTARINTKKISTCRGSFGGFETTCFQFDRAASFKTTKISYFGCNRSNLSITRMQNKLHAEQNIRVPFFINLALSFWNLILACHWHQYCLCLTFFKQMDDTGVTVACSRRVLATATLPKNGRWSKITPCVSSQYKHMSAGTVGTLSHTSDRHQHNFTQAKLWHTVD